MPVPMLETPGEADGPEEESTRGTLPLGDSPSEPEYVPSLNEPAEADEPKEESLRGILPLEDFPLCRLAWRLRTDDAHRDGGGGTAAQPDASQPPHTTQPFGATSMRSALASTDT